MSKARPTLDDARELLHSVHGEVKGRDTSTKTLDALWNKSLNAHGPHYGVEVADAAPKNLTEANVQVEAVLWSPAELARVVFKPRGTLTRDESAPIVVARYKGHYWLIDGGHRLSKWAAEKNDDKHPVWILHVVDG